LIAGREGAKRKPRAPESSRNREIQVSVKQAMINRREWRPTSAINFGKERTNRPCLLRGTTVDREEGFLREATSPGRPCSQEQTPEKRETLQQRQGG